MHVGGFCWGGTKMFYDEVVDLLHKIFEVGLRTYLLLSMLAKMYCKTSKD